MYLVLFFLAHVLVFSNATSPTPTSPPAFTSVTEITQTKRPSSSCFSILSASLSQTSTTPIPADVFLNVPKLHVGSLSMDVENLKADMNLNANIGQVIEINAGVQISVRKVNLTLNDLDTQLQLIVRMEHLADIVNRVFNSIDLNPMIMNAANNITSVFNKVVDSPEGLLGSITQDDITMNFLIDNFGHILQEIQAPSGITSAIVGNYIQNMTVTGKEIMLPRDRILKTYSYAPLDVMVDIVFDQAGKIIQAGVQKTMDTT
jgi:hypothetical protein